ncbi:GNAT family N-acetyltransferase [Ancylobacter sp. 6x-1]|uniref:GNAT family N-acetyltransferase n=1 Tax=Ancylobacter crimeensis TaxID=2579147 RepID=A0ABT0DC89_9HYPH|nr:GNAT family N-acetyltransferase [Ancylobacter crimeensis]MCK0197586.1 GNAT family N-acetyltransferase [Ancylobacter crimeensis]
MPEAALRIRVESRIADIPADIWDSCARGSQISTTAGKQLSSLDNTINSASPDPFLSHAFLRAVEESGSATAQTGWLPQHLLLEDENGIIHAACPAFLKSHSRGEYVFDQGWAEAYERAGGEYYPKLQVAIPFTPATGPRLLVRNGPYADFARPALAQGLTQLAGHREASSVHATFLTETDARSFLEAGYLSRTDQQFHWHNAGYASFEEFLAALASRKRKVIRRERREALESGIEIRWITGSDITEEILDAFFGFYMETGSRKWGRPYLTRSFYSLVAEAMPEQILFVMARRAGRWIAGAINFIGANTLFGRHWGAIEHHPFLHFEVCYHQAIDYAIAHGLKTVEAGAQGEHKLARGYLPVTTHSAHWIADPGLRRAFADYLVRERAYVAQANAELAELGPFRRGSQPIEEEP